MKHTVLVGVVLSSGIALLMVSGFTPRTPARASAELQPSEPSQALVGSGELLMRMPEGEGAAIAELTEVYPRGRWRLADMNDLAQVMLWVSHVLVRHEGVTPRQLSFERSHWKSAPEAPPRSRRAAFEMASEIEQRLRAQPEAFDEIARATSEDVATRERGGSLGAIAAIYLRPWPKVLDALATLREGEVSRVVETEFGFHVLTRRPAPPEGRVSGARIIVGHADTTWFGTSAIDRRERTRSRLEALELAQVIYEKARARPDEFARLAREHSEHRDFERDGDFGEWSTREPTPFAAQVEVLQGLEVGEVAPPMDSLFGYQIIQRIPPRARRHYAMRSLNLPFDPELPDGDEASRASARRRAEAMLRDVQADPSRFAKYKQYCCDAAEQWVEGRGDMIFERVLAGLGLGKVAIGLVEQEQSYVIVQRTTPDAALIRPTSFELPRPEHPDMKFIVSHLQGSSQLRAVREKAAAVIHLDDEPASKFAWLHDAERLEKESASAPSWGVYQDVQRQTQELLGREKYRQYSKILQQHFEDYLLAPK